jgi:phosphoribosylformylglycinamidine synthase
MFLKKYSELNQDIFTINIEPEALDIDDMLPTTKEGLSLSLKKLNI